MRSTVSAYVYTFGFLGCLAFVVAFLQAALVARLLTAILYDYDDDDDRKSRKRAIREEHPLTLVLVLFVYISAIGGIMHTTGEIVDAIDRSLRSGKKRMPKPTYGIAAATGIITCISLHRDIAQELRRRMLLLD